MQRPPSLLRRTVAACLPAEDEQPIVHDLDLLYDERARRHGRLRAAWWYTRQTAGFIARVGVTRAVTFLGGSDGLREEVRYSARSLLHRPAFTAAFLLTLVVGTGVVCTVYAAARWVLLRPVPHVRAPDELFSMRLTMPEAPPFVAFDVSNPDLGILRQRLPSRDALAGISVIEVDLSRPGAGSFRVPGEMVSANYFNVLGTPLVAGRGFVETEDLQTSGAPAAIISLDLAEMLGRSGGSIVGTDIRINGSSVRVVGVAPKGFRGNELPGRAQLWMPLSTLAIIDPSADPRVISSASGGVWRKLIGRAPAGWTTAALEREAAGAVAAVRKASTNHSYFPEFKAFSISPGIGLDPGVRASVERTLTLLAGASVLLLLLAAANLANLTLVRATMTSTTTAIRYALGASRGRIARGVFVDAAVLAAAGTVGALMLASAWSRWYGSTQLSERGGALAGMGVDLRVLLVTLLVALGVSAVAFLKPAMMSRFVSLDMQLRRATAGAPSQRFRATLVAVQVGLSVVLLVSAGLLARTVANLRSIDLGFDPSRILTAAMDPHLHNIEAVRLGQFARDFERSAVEVNGVRAAGLISPSPLRSSYISAQIHRPGADLSAKPRPEGIVGAGYYVSAGFFDAIGAHVVAGSTRWSADSGEVVLTRGTVNKLFPGEQPGAVIGRVLPRSKGGLRLIGVVEDLRLSQITVEPPPSFFFPLASRLAGLSVTAFVNASGNPARLAGPMREVAARLAPELPLYDIRTARQAVDQQFAERHAMARAASTLGLIGLLLSAFGLYGVLANIVAGRRREIGIRAAMGAAPRRILLRVVRDGFAPVAVGLTAGIAGAWAVTKVIRTQLFAVERFDALSWTLALASLVVAAVVACTIPAWRASRVSPAEVLRSD